MTKVTFSYDAVEAAIMLFSALDEYSLTGFEGLPKAHPNKPCEISARAFRANAGASEARRWCIALAETSERLWTALSEDDRDNIVWDWEFIPAFVLFCVNWHDLYATTAASTEELLKLYREGHERHARFMADQEG